jgi:hypothetical protein
MHAFPLENRRKNGVFSDCYVCMRSEPLQAQELIEYDAHLTMSWKAAAVIVETQSR